MNTSTNLSRALKSLPLAIASLLAAPALAEPTLYVSTGSGNEVVGIDTTTHAITKRFTGVINPHGLTATPDGEYLLAGSLTPAANPADPNLKGTLYLVHPAHGHVMSTIPIADWSHHQGISPDGRYVVSTHPGVGGVSIVDMMQQQQVAFIATGPAPNYALFDPAGKQLYVTNTGNATVSVITVGDWQKKRDLPAGMTPGHMVLSADGKRLFVSNPGPGTVSMIDTAKGEITKTFKFGPGLHGIAISDDDKRLYATSKLQDTLFSAAIGGDDVQKKTLKPSPYHMEAVRGKDLLYVSSSNTPTVWLINQADLTEAGQIDLGKGEGHQAILSGN